ncbi:hypothetical protein Hanom_Chr09g00845321 [Helianthus anomalus]
MSYQVAIVSLGVFNSCTGLIITTFVWPTCFRNHNLNIIKRHGVQCRSYCIHLHAIHPWFLLV